MKSKNIETTKKLVEAALMIAISTVLSTLKLVDMPYGGSVTLASAIPVMLIAYRHGLSYGLGTAFTYGVIQQLLGLENFSYLPVPTPIAIIGLILFDYILAFLAIGIGGIFRGKFRKEGRALGTSQGLELAIGALTVSLIRYACHTIGGATVWAGLPIPDGAALIYSIGYNATYMIPETIINVLVAFYLGSAIDFTRSLPRPYPIAERGKSKEGNALLVRVLRLSSLFLSVSAIIADACMVFAHIQDPESGEFTLIYLKDVSWTAVIIVTAVCAVLAIALAAFAHMAERRAAGTTEE